MKYVNGESVMKAKEKLKLKTNNGAMKTYQ
jgi:hypothetical protein